jgi:hypothetical protein
MIERSWRWYLFGDQGDHTQQEYDTSKDANKPTAYVSGPQNIAPKPPCSQPQAANEQHKAAERDYWRRQICVAKWLNAVTLIAACAAVVGLIFVGIGLRQTTQATNAATEANGIASHNLVAANRAWLYPRDFNIAETDYGFFVTGLNENVGKEPATHVIFSVPDFGMQPVPMIIRSAIDQIIIPFSDICEKRFDPVKGNTVFPTQKLSYERPLPYPTEESRISATDAVNKGHAVFFFRDCVVYSTFGERHKTPFCFYRWRNFATGQVETKICPRNQTPD